jgi:tetratricopeptide (TPR) repeat protein
MNLANANVFEGRVEEGLKLHEEVYAFRSRAKGIGPADLAISLQNIGEALHALGRDVEAQARFEQALALFEKAVGPDHVYVAESLDGLGSTAIAAGKPEIALPRYRRSLSIREKTLGDKHIDLAKSLVGIGKAELLRNNFAAAVGPLERALILRQSRPVPPALLAEAEFELARALWATPADRDRATRLAESAKVGFEKARKAHDGNLVSAWLSNTLVQK